MSFCSQPLTRSACEIGWALTRRGMQRFACTTSWGSIHRQGRTTIAMYRNVPWLGLAGVFWAGVVFTQTLQTPGAALQNPVIATPASLSAGKRAYDTNCAACHGNLAQGAVKAGVALSIIS